MYLSVSKRDNGKRKYLSIQKRYWDAQTKKRTSKTIESLGYLDILEKEYEDPIAHFKAVAKQMTENELKERKVSIEIDMNEELPMGASGARNFGYAVPMKIYHKLRLDEFLKRKMRGENFEFNTNSIMILLVLSRILDPSSKKKAFENKGRYFERFDFTIDDVYRALSHYSTLTKELQCFLHESVRTSFGCNTKTIYYDVTNYYFEIKRADDWRKFGVSKEKRKKPIIQMGLAMDADGIPLHYELFPGNKLDKETFRSVIGEIKRNYDTGRIIVVADMGVITGDNIYYLTGGKQNNPLNGYVFSFSVRGGTEKFQEYVLGEKDYRDESGKPATEASDFKIKSRRIARDINVTLESGKIVTKVVYEKQVVFWSRKYFDKARAERAEIIAKAEKLIADPKKYSKATSYGAAAYVNHLSIDKATGEVKAKKGKHLELKRDKIELEEMFDGYYAIVTSELEMEDMEITETYRGLWEIEETFKITKGDLSARPVHVSKYEHINAHFLICFIALTIIRLMQKQTGKMYSTKRIVDCLNKIECMSEYGNIYLFGYRCELSDTLGKDFGINFSHKRMRLDEIKKALGDTKK
jgi:transposase